MKFAIAKTPRETLRLALSEGEGRVVSEEELDRAVSWLDAISQDTVGRVFAKQIYSGSNLVRWSKEDLGELEIANRR